MGQRVSSITRVLGTLEDNAVLVEVELVDVVVEGDEDELEEVDEEVDTMDEVELEDVVVESALVVVDTDACIT